MVPVVIMHGLGGTSEDLDPMSSWIREGSPDTYVVNILIDASWSMTHSIHEQALEIQRIAKDDPKLSQGFIVIGLSQGGFVWRHYTEMINDPPVIRLIGYSSPMAGFYSDNDDCLGGQCGVIRRDPYSKQTYDNNAVAGWWKDPFDTENFEKQQLDLALLDNVRDYDEMRKTRFAALDQLILVGSPKDGVLVPWQAALFGYFYDNSYSAQSVDFLVEKMTDRQVFTKDLFGLKTLYDSGRVFQYECNQRHNDYMTNRVFFDNFLLKHCKKNIN